MACQVPECVHAGQERIQGYPQVHGQVGRGVDHGQVRGTARIDRLQGPRSTGMEGPRRGTEPGPLVGAGREDHRRGTPE
eukprot:7917274-Alexandrium_andersonii.AAC.1